MSCFNPWISKTGELPKPLRKEEGGFNGFSNPTPLELQNSNIFFQKALPRACKVRRGADTWYTIARPTATTSSGNRPGTREPPQRLGKPLKLFRNFFFTKKDRGSFYDIKQTQRKYLLIDGNPSRHRFASTLIPSQMGGIWWPLGWHWGTLTIPWIFFRDFSERKKKQQLALSLRVQPKFQKKTTPGGGNTYM